jgi:nucleoid DNA-binding protein
MLATMRNALRRGESVTLVRFGTFSVARRRPRTIRNPKTGLATTVTGRALRFRPSKELKEAVR